MIWMEGRASGAPYTEEQYIADIKSKTRTFTQGDVGKLIKRVAMCMPCEGHYLFAANVYKLLSIGNSPAINECAQCHRVAKLVCGKCGWEYYCDKTCQTKHWSYHKAVTCMPRDTGVNPSENTGMSVQFMMDGAPLGEPKLIKDWRLCQGWALLDDILPFEQKRLFHGVDLTSGHKFQPMQSKDYASNLELHGLSFGNLTRDLPGAFPMPRHY